MHFRSLRTLRAEDTKTSPKAKAAVNSANKSIKPAAKASGIPFSTLGHYVHNRDRRVAPLAWHPPVVAEDVGLAIAVNVSEEAHGKAQDALLGPSFIHQQ